MILLDFTSEELEYFRQNCNFVGDELLFFELHVRSVPLEEIAQMLSITTDEVSKIGHRVNRKICKVL